MVLSGKMKPNGHSRSNRIAFHKVQDFLIPFFQWITNSQFAATVDNIKC